MNTWQQVARVLLQGALLVLALLLIKTAPFIFIPLFIIAPFLWFKGRGRAPFGGEEDPADWWKKGNQE